ncbi:MAG: hypothetical protein GX147_05910 [Deltaproteobacteria bacterium]|nr:hypothetical protein [Deltaproteobacteria bacterium]
MTVRFIRPCGVLLAVLLAVTVVSPCPVFSAEENRPGQENFFVVNPSLMPHAVARQTAEGPEPVLQGLFEPGSPLDFEGEEPIPPRREKSDEFGFLGLKMSLSRLELEPDSQQRIRMGGGDPLLWSDFRAIFSGGSFGRDEFDAFVDVFRPQLNLGIPF